MARPSLRTYVASIELGGAFQATEEEFDQLGEGADELSTGYEHMCSLRSGSELHEEFAANHP